MFAPVAQVTNFSEIEERLIAYWKKNKTFEKSISTRDANKKWTFLDGPPFVTGLPHYGHLLGSIHKDVFGRYWTMKGYRVRRVWGWDGHGLPIENKVEGKLGVKRKKDIEEIVGVKKFIDECKVYVGEISGEWEWYVDHIARWVDFKNAYKTWDTPYMESVMWVFKQMYDKGHIYKGLRVSLYCPHCSTPISNFEVAMDADNYKDFNDEATTYKYQLVENPETYILAWSTTPWNKIATPVLAVNPSLQYVKVRQGKENYILAQSTLKMLKNEPYEIIEEFSGKDLVGKKFVPHYDYYKDNVEKGQKVFEIIPGDFVTADEGTGVVTIGAYGEEDLKVMKEQNTYIELHLDEEGMVKKHIPLFGGEYYLKANKLVNEDLDKRGLLYKNEPITHRLPTCWRCHTRLYYAPLDAWYVNVQNLKPLLKNTNEEINWFPKHFKYGRFLKSLEHAPDWNISRNRYWGSPVPVWECECGERFVPGSIADLEKASGQKVPELHKPEIDEVMVTCAKCGKKVKRVAEVLDSWIEAGSASFAERHFPFNKEEKLEDFFPPDFIAEYTGQIRAWFYVLHVIGGALYKTIAFKNVGVEGVILGSDGRKMSKNLGNYPDPKEMLTKYGGDALRLYLMGSPIMNGEDIIISEEQYRNQVRGFLLILWNVYNYFVTYANENKWEHQKATEGVSKNILDRWILSVLNTFNKKVADAIEKYDTVEAIEASKKFIDELSTWYIRRSRDRVSPLSEDKEDRDAFFTTTYHVLLTACKILAPLTPFISEEIYTKLTNEESVHLAYLPDIQEDMIDSKLEEEMRVARKVVEMAHAHRKESGFKLRQPLGKLAVVVPTGLSDEVQKVVADEVNVKKVVVTLGETLSVDLDTKLTPELQEEGEARDIARQIQEERKKLGTTLTDKVVVTIPSWPSSQEEYIMKKALVSKLVKGATFSVEKA
ncbi:MAG TPA: isoleucine--tRNA ligase [Candidatus Eisenbacteria bacterium]|nr:isoleucine--tRNA ligase [Candidatus Eisenbacteria bacterium]